MLLSNDCAGEDAAGSYEHCRLCDVVMGGGESAFSLTIGVGTGCIMMRSRVGCCSSLGTEKRRRKQSKSCSKKK